ncbi:uncharacterized protein hhla2b.2 isoform X2 [Denticeps clupeoides]|uniref:uncharacterized protein hhla2b.2 isoform X2 n=1 Tax=Denticeps clupeoides TaxID=299321 RepID=UPI0010A54977|nr:HERV-H LTR-associating protein 2 isoform X2 [Denticeps clupeoides]
MALKRTMLLLLLTLQWTLRQVKGQDSQVTCPFRAECILPCSFPPSIEEIIHWHFGLNTDQTVHTYYHKKDQFKFQIPRYSGRTSLFSSQIPRGNASLLLRNVTWEDQGRYQCYISTKQASQESFVVLTVKDEIPRVNISVKDHELMCSSTQTDPNPQLSWTTDPPSDMNAKTVISPESSGLFSVKSTLDFNKKQDTIYTCTIRSEGLEIRATLKQTVKSLQQDLILTCTDKEVINSSLTWTFNDDIILTYDNRTSHQKVSDQWRDHFSKRSLHNLNRTGTYVCSRQTSVHRMDYVLFRVEEPLTESILKSTNLNQIQTFQTKPLSRCVISGPSEVHSGVKWSILAVLIILIIIIIIIISITVLVRRLKKSKADNRATRTSNNGTNLEMSPLHREPEKTLS